MASSEKILYDVIQYDKWRDTYMLHTESHRWTHPTNPIIKFLYLTFYSIIFPFVLLFTLPHKLISSSRRKHPTSHSPLSLTISPCHRYLAVLTPSSLLILVRNAKPASLDSPLFSRQSGYIYSLTDDVIMKHGSPFQIVWSMDSKYTVVLIPSISPRIMVFDTRANKIGDIDLSIHEIPDPCQVLIVGCGPHQMIHRCLLLSRTGSLHWFSVRNSGELGELSHRIELGDTHPRGVCVMRFHSEGELLYLGGSGIVSGRNLSTLRSTISVWRVVEEDPGFMQVHHVVGQPTPSPSRRGYDVTDMSINSNNQLLLTSHLNGTLAIWHMPSLTIYKQIFPQTQKRAKSDCLLSLAWWSEGDVVTSYTSGRLDIFNLQTELNVLKEDRGMDTPVILTTFSTDNSVFGISYEELTNEAVVHTNAMNLKERFSQFVFSLTGIQSLQQFEVSNFACEYSLVLLKQVSPLGLYKRKISQKSYQEALSLAKEFSLDINLLYQSQWESSSHSVEDISLYLSRVSDARYVLKQCLQVNAPDVDSAHEIIEVGLSRVQDCCCEQEDLILTGQNFDKEHARLVRMRLMLDCYSSIFNSNQQSSRFQPKIFNQMCSTPLLHLMSLLAIERNYSCLEVLYSRFYVQLRSHWLAILIFIPEIEHPSNYQSLLPTGASIPYKGSDFECQHDDLGELEFYAAHPGLDEFRNSDLSNEDCLSDWFIFRARQIDNLSGQYRFAAWLINYATTENVPRLLPIRSDLWFLSVAVEELRGASSELIGLSDVEKMSKLERIQFVLEGVVVSNFFERFKKYIEPILEFYEISEQGNKFDLMKEFLLEIAHENLPLCQVLFQRCFVDKQSLLSSLQMTQLAIDCIYSCEIPAHLANAFSIFECLPSREELVIETLAPQLNQLEMVLKSVSILQNYSIFLCPNEVLDHQKGEEQEVRLLILRLAHKLAKQRTFPSQRVWEQLLLDILSLRETVFSQLTVSSCYSLFSHTLMSSQCNEGVQLASSLLRLDPGGLSRLANETYTSEIWKCHLSYDESVQVALQASQEYFNASSHFMDQDMQLARSCLHLMQPPPDALQEELNLIAVLSILDDFMFEIMPVQLRACEDRFKLVKRVIDVRPDNYRKKQKIEKLITLLQISTKPERDGTIDYYELMLFIAEKALEAEDWRTCEEYCYILMRSHYLNAWRVCHQLGAVGSFNIESRKTLIGYSIENCPPEELASILATSTYNTIQMLETATATSTSSQVIHKVSRIMGKALKTTGLGNISYLSGFTQISTDAESETTSHTTTLSISKHHFYDDNSNRYLPCNQLTNSHVLLLKTYSVLQEKDTLQELLKDSTFISNLNTYLVACLKTSIRSDTTLFIGYLFEIRNIALVWNSLLELSRHKLTSELYIYYLAIIICSHVLKQHAAIRSMLFTNPLEFVQSFERHFFQRLSQDCSNALDLISEFDYARHHLLTIWETSYLQKISFHFDVDSYFTDHNYQKLLIKKMAENSDTFDFALSIAGFHDIRREVVFMQLLNYQLLNSHLKFDQLQALLVDKGATDCLKECPLFFFETIRDKIYPHISGTDYDKILFCFHLFSECESAIGDPIYAIPHSKLSSKELSKLIVFSSEAVPSMDFKAFTESPNPIYVLKQHLTFENIPKLSEVDTLVVSSNQVPITENDLYWAFCCHQTDQYKPTFDAMEVDNSALISAMNHLSTEQIVRLYKEVLFSLKSLSISPTELQLKFQFICTALNQISSHAIKRELHLQISLFSKHMHVCFSPPISGLPMIELKNNFYLSTSEPNSISSLLSNSLKSGTSVQVIGQVLTAASSVCEQIFDITGTFHDVVISLCFDFQKEFIPEKRETSPKMKFPSFEAMKLIFESLECHQDISKYITSNFLSDLLQEVMNLSDLLPELKSSISKLFHSSEDWIIIKLKIKAIIGLYWDFDISGMDISSHANQVTLVTYLLAKGEHYPDVHAILTFLPGSKRSLCDYWFSLMLSWSKYQISDIVEFASARFELGFSEVQDDMIANILTSTNPLFQLMYILATPHNVLIIKALEAAIPFLADNMNDFDSKHHIYELILLNGLVPFILESKIWSDFLAYVQGFPQLPLTEIGRIVNNKRLVISSEISPIEALCSQLHQAGYKLESAAINSYTTLPSRFISFNSVVKWISKHEKL